MTFQRTTLASCLAGIVLLAGCATTRDGSTEGTGAAPAGIGLERFYAAPRPSVASTITLAEVRNELGKAKHSVDPTTKKRRLRPPSPGLTPQEADALRARAMEQDVDTNIVPLVDERVAGATAPVDLGEVQVLANADALDVNDCCGNPATASVPPDPEMAAGPNHVIGVVNTAFEVYDRNGASLAGPFEFDAFFTGVTGCTNTFDPNVLWDDEADRFILGIDGNGTHYCFAVSVTNDPTGAWHRYSFPTAAAGEFFDFPHIGVGEDAIFMGANMFNAAGTAFLDGRVWAINKSIAYAGGTLPPPPVKNLRSGTGGIIREGTPQPADNRGSVDPPAGRHYIITDNEFDGDRFGIWAWDDPFGANTTTKIGIADLAAASGVVADFPIDQPQFGTAATVQGNDWRVQDADFRNGRLWMAHNLSCNIGAGPSNCARWAEIDPTDASVEQAGVVAMFNRSLSFGNVAPNERGDMLIGFTVTGPTRLPSVYIAGRVRNDPPGQVRDPVLLRQGEVSYQSFEGIPYRWGDYSEAVTDPDGLTFWYIGEFSKDTTNPFADWGTQISHIALGFPDALFRDGFEDPTPVTPPPPVTPEPAVRIELLVNLEDADTVPGLTIDEGTEVIRRYIVYNDGNTRLTSILVTDDDFGTIGCPRNSLEAGEDMICDRPIEVAGGNDTFTGTATVVARVGSSFATVSDTDTVAYVYFAPPGQTCIGTAGSTNCPGAIPDGLPGGGGGTTLVSTFAVTGCANITDVNVGLLASHTWVGDLVVTLQGPTGAPITLINAPNGGGGGCNGNDVNVLLDDEAATAVQTTCSNTVTPAISGNRRPASPLTPLDGTTGNGTWTLRVTDTFAGDVGTLRNWSVQLSCN